MEKSNQRNPFSTCQKFLSSETELLHIQYDKRPAHRGDTISIYHNLIYILVLFRQKKRSDMEQAIKHLEHLLHYQINNGNFLGCFPKYLHQFPNCERRFEVVDDLLPIYYIYKEFHSILPKPLKAQLLISIELAFGYLQSQIKECSLGYLIKQQIACLLKAYGQLLNKAKWNSFGLELLNEGFNFKPEKSWSSPRLLSKLVLFWGLLDKEQDAQMIEFIQNYLRAIWNPGIKAYTGPGLNEHFFQHKQEPTLLHFMLDHESETDHFFEEDLIEAALLPGWQISEGFIYNKPFSFDAAPFAVTCANYQNYSYSYFNLDEVDWEKRGGFYPFKLVYSHEDVAIQFALQMGSLCTVKSISSSLFEFTFMPKDGEPIDISFFMNAFDSIRVVQGGHKATMFSLSQPVEIEHGSKTIQVSLKSRELVDHLWLQLHKSNKRSQIDRDLTHHYDWHLYLRETQPVSKPFTIQLELIGF